MSSSWVTVGRPQRLSVIVIGSPGSARSTATALTLTSAVLLVVCPNKFNRGVKNNGDCIAAPAVPPWGLLFSNATRTPLARTLRGALGSIETPDAVSYTH